LRGYVGPDDGYIVKALRILSAASLLVVVAAGCGGAAGPQRSALHGVPPALAQDWEGRASDIAVAVSGGDSCRALKLANALRADVVASKDRVPSRLRPPLLSSVRGLADRIKCTPVVQTPSKEPATKPPPKPEDKGHGKGHDEGHDKGHEKGHEK
jgi:hypothetical protein